MLPETNEIKAKDVSERLREKVSKQNIIYNNINIQVTVSIGIASIKANLHL